VSTARPGNPASGNLEEVSTFARHYTDVAEALDRITAELRAIVDGESELAGRSVRAVEGDLASLSGVMRQVSVRYRGAAQGVDRFAAALQSLQGEGNRLIDDRQWFVDGLRDLEPEMADAQARAAVAGAGQADALADVERLRRDEESMREGLAYLDAQLRRVGEDYERAAWALYWTLDSAMANSDLDDGWGADVLSVLDDVLSVFVDVLEIVGLIITILAAIVCFIASVFIPALAGVGAALLLVAKIIAIAIFVIEVVRLAMTGFDFVAFAVALVSAVAALVGGALIEALGRAVGSLLSAALTKALGEVLARATAQLATTAVVGALHAALDVAVEAVVSLGGPVAQAYFEALMRGGGALFASQLADVGNMAQTNLEEWGGQLADAIGDSPLGEVLGEAIGDLSTGAQTLGAAAVDGLQQLRQGAVDALGERTVSALEDFVGDVLNGRDPLDAGRDALGAIGADLADRTGLDGWLENAADDARDAVDAALDELLASAGGDLGAWEAAASDLWDAAEHAFGSDVAHELVDAGRALAEGGSPIEVASDLLGGETGASLAGQLGIDLDAVGERIADAVQLPELVVSELGGALDGVLAPGERDRMIAVLAGGGGGDDGDD